MAEVGCVEREASTEEREALVDFYTSFNGDEWRFHDNWNEGDPCTNQWFGIGCNTEGNVISIHFFENHLNGTFPNNFHNLVHLKHLSIFNGDTGYEGEENLNANCVKFMLDELGAHTELEELNLAWLTMQGSIPVDITSLTKIKFINLSNNELGGQFPL